MNLDIMHIDMDAFFAAVEVLDNPDLKGKPVIVGGVKLDRRGVVSTASYEARKYGVHSAMPMVEARRLCPEGIFLPGRGRRYAELSQLIFNVFYRFTPLVEAISIDEAFLDLRGCHRLYGSSVEIGKRIKREIKEEIGLTASVGLAPNKFLAKLASGLGKPDGFFIIEEECIGEILDPLPVGKLWGVGKKTRDILEKRGIKTVGALKKLSASELEALLGKYGVRLYELSRGIDNRPVEPDNERKSVSHEETYSENLAERKDILARLLAMSGKVIRRLRKKGLTGNIVFIKIRYGDFSTYTRRITLKSAVKSTDELYQAGKRLLLKDRLLEEPVRLLGIGVSGLKDDQGTQLSLFSDRIKEEELSRIVDGIRDRFGEGSIIRARNLSGLGKNEKSE